jgi:hypothetical protein
MLLSDYFIDCPRAKTRRKGRLGFFCLGLHHLKKIHKTPNARQKQSSAGHIVI